MESVTLIVDVLLPFAVTAAGLAPTVDVVASSLPPLGALRVKVTPLAGWAGLASSALVKTEKSRAG